MLFMSLMLFVAFPLAWMVTVLWLARHRLGRLSLQPTHGHAFVLTQRYFLATWSMPLVFTLVVRSLAGHPGPALPALVMAACTAGWWWWTRDSRSMDRAMEGRVHWMFGGLLGLMASAHGVMVAGVLGVPIHGWLAAMLPVMIYGAWALSCAALALFGAPLVRRPPAGELEERLEVEEPLEARLAALHAAQSMKTRLRSTSK